MTNLRNCLDTASIYCGTYAKYNNGSLYGKWLNLGDYSDYDELQQVMYELHSDESDPEFMLQDYEGCELFEKLGLISECHLSKDIYDIAEQINDSGHDTEVYEAVLDNFMGIDFQTAYEYVNNFYYGWFNSDIDFVEYLYVIYLSTFLALFALIGRLQPVMLCMIILKVTGIILNHSIFVIL